MSKTIKCEVPRWKGTITVADPMTVPQALGFERANNSAEDLLGDYLGVHAKTLDKTVDDLTEDEEDEARRLSIREISISERDGVLLVGLLDCVEEHTLVDTKTGDPVPTPLTPENFPGSPVVASAQLISQIQSAILTVWKGEDEIPNE